MRAIKRPSPVQRKARWAGPSLALWPVLPWVLRSLEPCLALSLVPQSAQRKSGREERSRRPLRQGDGRQRSGPLLPRNAAHRKERRRLKSLRARVEALRLNRGELHHNGGSQRAHHEVRRLSSPTASGQAPLALTSRLVSPLLNFFGLQLIDVGKPIVGTPKCPQDFIELRVDGLGIAVLGALNEKRHKPGRERLRYRASQNFVGRR